MGDSSMITLQASPTDSTLRRSPDTDRNPDVSTDNGSCSDVSSNVERHSSTNTKKISPPHVLTKRGRVFHYFLRSLKRYCLTQTKVKPHVCTHCGKGFACLRNLSRHFLMRVCADSGKTFLSLYSRKRRHHRLTHTEGKPHVCDFCGKGFARPNILKIHLRIHTGEKPYVCTVCGKRFAQSGTLYQHHFTHSGEKPHVCTVCGKRFALSGTLQRHHRTHSGEKPHVCTVCGKRFALSGNLKAHRVTHSEVKPHLCTECGARFALFATLKRHCIIHTGEKNFVCSTCGKGFSRKDNLKRHHDNPNGCSPKSRVTI